jgi:hypothetical protein
MPIEASFGNLGTETDGSPSTDYCSFCFRDGAFTNTEQTVDGMVQSSIDFMTANLGYSAEEASSLSNDVIRKLKRWQ